MTLMKWRPRTHRGLPTLFDDLWERPFRHLDWPYRGERANWRPTSDVIDRKDDILVRVELPGVNKEDVHISLSDSLLTIKGERKQENKEEGECYHCQERAWGSFERSFYLPADVDAKQINASYKEGVLEVHLPKNESARTREINIEAN